MFSRAEVIYRANKAVCSRLGKKEHKLYKHLALSVVFVKWEVVSDSS